MDISGRAREGWMTFIPVTVLVFVVMYVMGGPGQFVNAIAQWGMDVVNSVSNWIRHL